MRFARGAALALCLCAGCGDVDGDIADDGSVADAELAVTADAPRDVTSGARPDGGVDAGADRPTDRDSDVGIDAGLADRPDPIDARGISDAADVPDVPEVSPMRDPGLAPRDAVAGERHASDGANTVTLSPSAELVLRVDARSTEHIQFFLRFTPTDVPVVMQVDRWDGQRPVELGRTDAGRGLRVLAAFDPTGTRTFYARLRIGGRSGANGTLTVTRTPFADGARCPSDCARLLQLPLANDPAVDGYAATQSTVFRYQFGRRDLLMFLRHAGRTMALAAGSPFVPEDLSQWDGMTPGADVGALRHASHQRGKDVDISLYGTDGRAPWRSYCTVVNNGDGRECVAGTARNLDGAANARHFADWFATGRVTMCFLDRALIAVVREAAARAGVERSLLPLYSDGTHLQHWPNHDNHVHVRVSEAMPGALVYEPWEAP